jgi:hypothetical protein
MTRNTARIFGASMLAMAALLLCTLPLAAQDNNTYINRATRFAVSPRLDELAKLPPSPQYGFHEANPVRRVPKRPIGPVVDTAEQRGSAPSANYSIVANILGVGTGFPGYSVPDAPPDTTMAVGDNQIVQWVNTSYTVCQKASPYTCGPAIEGNTLWTTLGGACASENDGDIIAQWDVVAHRWLLAQNNFDFNNNLEPPYNVCVAISTSNDANGTYFLYSFPVVNNGFPDYPKWGIWTANYGQTWNNFGPGAGGFVGPVFCAYNRTKLLAGDQTAEQICHQYSGSEDSLLPADRDGIINPPNGEDQFAIGSVGDVDDSHLSLYSVHINDPSNWSAGATFTGDNNSQLLSIATFNPSCNGQFGGACVPQKGISDKADSLGDRLMYRFAYSNDGPPPNVAPCATCAPPRRQHWLVNFDVTASGGNIGPRWMEITAASGSVPVTSLSVFQQGTYAPDGNWRWMGSLARDKAGDILLGYSVSCGSTCPGGTTGGVFPSVFVTGRQASDTLGTMETETQVVGGTGSQPDTGNRWGDYSSMRLDTNDGMSGCTFWYTQEYYMVTMTFDWSTRINSAKFSNCH